MVSPEIHNYFKDKKVTVMGLGLLGRGVGDALFLAECGAHVTVTDLKSSEQLAESVQKLKEYPNITFVLGEHRNEDFENVDMVLVAAGVPLDSPYVAHARDKGVHVTMSAALVAKLSQLPVIGVTGTRGKSTVSHMVHHTLVQANIPALLGGNIRGVSNLQLLKEIATAQILVMELDSWQLQGFGWEELSPHIAVFTNLFEDHLNYYPNMETYFLDKANIYTHQKEGDYCIISQAVVDTWIGQHPPVVEVQFPEALPADWKLQIPGEHNRENASFAKTALEAYGLSEDAIQKGLESFVGVEGRLQFVREIDGIKLYNDNNATTPQATTVALKALSKEASKIVLIAGGADKGLQFKDLVAVAKDTVEKHPILLEGTGTEKLQTEMEHAGMEPVVVSSLAEAIAMALDTARIAKCTTVLFSPGCASFGMFKNEYERNDQFMSIVEKV